MNVMPLTDNYSVTAQISAHDIAAIAAAGFKSIICNRPDQESADQPDFATIDAAAQAAGLQTAYIPITGMPSPEQTADMAQALTDLPAPVLAYCRTGNRSAIIFNAAQA
jgi:sulfide:quinone oxidoreductase